jgi:hypothetical protein
MSEKTNSKHRSEWFAIRLPHKKRKEKKIESGPLTHAAARKIAEEWYFDGYQVEMQRRRKDEKAHSVTPQFPLIDRKRRRAAEAAEHEIKRQKAVEQNRAKHAKVPVRAS